MSDPSPWSREGSAAEPDVIVVPALGTWVAPPEISEPGVVRRGRGKWIAIAAVAFIALVLAGSAIGLALSTANHGGPARHSGPATLTAPETIGSYIKQNQAPTDMLTDMMRDNGAEHPFAAMYLDDQGHPVLVWGGTDERYRSGSAAARLEEVFLGLGVLGVDQSARVAVDPGPTGGDAECVPSNGSGWNGTICGWTGSGALLGLMFGGTGLSDARTKLPAMLSAIVTF